MVADTAVGHRHDRGATSGAHKSSVLVFSRQIPLPNKAAKSLLEKGSVCSYPLGVSGLLEEGSIHLASLEGAITFGSDFIKASFHL